MQRLIDDALFLLGEYHASRLSGFVNSEARFEQGLPPLETGEVGRLALELLSLPDDETLQIPALEDAGVERSLHALQSVLSHWRPPTASSRSRQVYPYLPACAGSATLLLEQVEFRVTGLIVRAVIWTGLPSGSGGEYDGDRVWTDEATNRGNWWWGFNRVTDDVGTRYIWSGSAIDRLAPVPVSDGAWTGIRLAQRYKQTWYPGPPAAAKWLYLTPDRDFAVPAPEGSSPDRTHAFGIGEVHYSVRIPRGIGLEAGEHVIASNQSWREPPAEARNTHRPRSGGADQRG